MVPSNDWHSFAMAVVEYFCDIVGEIFSFVVIVIEFVVGVVEALGVLQVVGIVFYIKHPTYNLYILTKYNNVLSSTFDGNDGK